MVNNNMMREGKYMKRIFVQFGSGLGSMSRVFPIVKLLKERGYIIKYSGYPTAKKYMDMLHIEELDSTFCFNDKKIKNPRAKWETAEEFWEMMGYNDWGWIEKKVNQLSKSIVSFKPDLIISDLGFLCWMSAKLLRIPLVTITQSCYHPERKYEQFRWWEEREEKESTFRLKNWINECFDKNNIKPLDKFEEIFTGDLTLIPSYEEIDWLNGENKFNTRYVGPILFNEEEAYHEPDLGKEERPTIFCYTGRFYDNVGKSGEDIFISTVQALKNRNVNLIISVGGTKEMEIAQKILKQKNYENIDNLYIAEFLPMNYAYRISDLIIHHGGHGSCLGQINYEKPSLIIPTHSEREYNARIFEKLGFSEVISSEDVSAELVYDKVNKMLNDHTYKNNISKYNKQIEQKKNMKVEFAIEAIEKVLKVKESEIR